MMTQQCLSRGQLKEYLSGWADLEITEQIEAHLASCSDCEQTVVALEAEPDTLLEMARSEAPESEPEADAVDSPIAQALRAAKLHVPISKHAEVAEAKNSWPMLGHEIAGYELLRPLGRGGMGTVYVAKHRKLGKEVAIKLLPSEAFRDPHFASRFEREMRAAGGLEHTSIVRATDAGEVGGVHYLVMELVDGLDLSRIVRFAGQLEIADACELARQIALGLSHAHSAGVVHRDIKPSNIVVSRDGTAKLLDFGLARTELWDELSVELTTVGQLMGTIDYMAPEQAERPETVDYRADLYALGATLFRLLAGRTPLSISPSLSPLAKLRLLAMHEPPLIDTLRDDTPSELVTLTAELLARNPDARPPSADHVAQRLLPLAHGNNLSRLVALAIDQAERETDFDLQLAPERLSAADSSSKKHEQANDVTQADDGIRSGQRRGRFSTWTTALSAASALALVVAGVLFTLETQKGQLVVESDVPGVTVQIKQDGKVARELTVENGAESTRLWAGKYEVVLSAGSDSVQVTDGSVSVMRGETKIARVQLIDKSNWVTSGDVANIPPGATSELQPGDTIRMTSLQDSGLNVRQIKVMADSTVKLPMVGTVSVKGKSIEQFEAELNQRYAKWVLHPAIEVFRDELPARTTSNTTSAMRGRAVPPASTAPLQPGDALLISSFQDDTIACRVVVQADHTIKPTMVGTVSVKGKTVDHLEQDLEIRYSKHCKDPAIQIFRDFTVPSPSWSPASQSNTQQLSAALQQPIEEPMYDSRTLSEWLELLRRERSSDALFDVFTALDALVSKSTSEQITKAVLDILPSRDGSMSVTRERSRSTFDRRSFSLLRRANSGTAYCDLLQQQLSSSSEPQWKQRIASQALVFQGMQTSDIANLDAWLLSNVLIGSEQHELRADVMESYRANASSTQTTAEVADLLIGSIAKVTDDGQAFWLEKFQGDAQVFWLDEYPTGSSAQKSSVPLGPPETEVYWNTQWTKEVAGRAMAVLKDAKAPQRRIVQAERVLYFLCCADRDEELGIDRAFIRDWVVKRTKLLSAEDLLETVSMPADFRRSYLFSSYTGSASNMTLGVFQVVLKAGDEADVEALALIELAHATLTQVENQQFLNDVLSRIETHLFDMNFKASPNTYVISTGLIPAKIEFPEFKDAPYASPEQWIAFIINYRIICGLDRESLDEFGRRMAINQGERWFASMVGGNPTAPKPLAVTFERARESLIELHDAADAQSGTGISWNELCSQVDKDNDAKLDASEFASLYIRLRSLPMKSENPGTASTRRVIGRYDTNGDGVLTKDEWDKMIVKPTKADYNKDGIITVEEYAKYRQN